MHRKSHKLIPPTDKYSKNPIIDSLIKQKLQSQISIVKDNFHKLLRRQQDRKKQQMQQDRKSKREDDDAPHTGREHSLRRRRLSSLSSLKASQIKDNLMFNPYPSKEVIAFLSDRQYNSPLIAKDRLISINQARDEPQNLSVKFQNSDRFTYEQIPIQKLQEWSQKQIEADLWISSKQEVIQAVKNTILGTNRSIDNPMVKLNSKNGNMPLLSLPLASKANDQHFKPIYSSRVRSLDKTNNMKNQMHSINDANVPIAVYQYRKYHKDDYISLDKWLTTTLSSIKADQREMSTQKICSQLERVYAAYVCTWKELIRLNYIQSNEKGLFIDKLLWSTFRMFNSIIQIQHSLNYKEFRQFAEQNKTMREMYEDRISKLQKKMIELEQQCTQLKESNCNLILSAMSYRKVNLQLGKELQNVMAEKNKLTNESAYVSDRLMRICTEMQQRGAINQMRDKEQRDIYYFINSKGQTQIIIKLSNNSNLNINQNSNIKNQSNPHIYNMRSISLVIQHKAHSPVAFDRYGAIIPSLENQLNQFWALKSDDLQIQKLIRRQVGDRMLQDMQIQVSGSGPAQFATVGIQVEQQQTQSFAAYMQRQFQSQKQTWISKQKEYSTLVVSLKELYEQANMKINLLNQELTKTKRSLFEKREKIQKLQQSNAQLLESCSKGKARIKELQNQLQKERMQVSKVSNELQEMTSKYSECKNQLLIQKENSKILVVHNIELKDLKAKWQDQFTKLDQTLKALAPDLEQFIQMADCQDASSFLYQFGKHIEDKLRAYVERDAMLFITK